MSGKFLLDTNTISHLIARRLPSAERRVAKLAPNQLLVSAMSYGEVWFGLYRRPSKVVVREAMATFFLEVDILPWTKETANLYAGIRADLERVGKPLGALDMLIAAHALQAGATLVSNDGAFRHVPGLTVEDWTAA
jgi:tRNA(fMet)-specific endonuclease VapC